MIALRFRSRPRRIRATAPAAGPRRSPAPIRLAAARGARLAAVLAALAGLGGAGLGAGCSHGSPPATSPAGPEPPPLPPASGTPIGYLLDDARLALTADQRAQLRAIDDELAARLAYLDTVVRNAGPDTTPPGEPPSRGGITFSASSERDGRDQGHVSAQDRGQPGAVGGGVPPGAAADNAATLGRVPEVRAHDVHTAIARALRLLDPGQQQLAREVLVDRGVNPDAGRFQHQDAPGPGGRDRAR